jgi:hypothetical protein
LPGTQLTVEVVDEIVPVTTVGAAGTTSVITGLEKGLAEELPITLVATTEKL